MNSINSPYTSFNKQLKTFCRELERSFPDLWYVKALTAGYKFLKTMNKKLPHKYFHEMFYIQHGAAAKCRDDSTIFSDSYQPPILYANIINNLKTTWLSLDKATKDTIFDHLIVLISLNEKCIEYRETKKMPPIESLADDNVGGEDE